jgi:hypothetical protein
MVMVVVVNVRVEEREKRGCVHGHSRDILVWYPAVRLWMAIPEILLGSRGKKRSQLYGFSG